VTLLSIIVPLLNEAANLGALHERLSATASKLDREVELIFVDDGSTDDSFARLVALREKDPRVRVVRFSRNFGSHAACLAGYVHCKGDHAVIISADLQDPPELILDLVAATKDADVVWASREARDDPALTMLFSSIYNRLMRKIALPNYPEKGFDFVIVSRRVLDVIVARRERNSSLFAQILWTGFRQKSVPYARVARRVGASKWTFWKKVKLALDSIVSFSYFPIRLMSVVGILCAILGALHAVVVISLRIAWGAPITGWASLMVVVLVMGGVQMMTLGVIGEYLWRTLDEARARPPFIVAETVGLDRSG
jgi:dolichol-phosphate mannosyltransferase